MKIDAFVVVLLGSSIFPWSSVGVIFYFFNVSRTVIVAISGETYLPF